MCPPTNSLSAFGSAAEKIAKSQFERAIRDQRVKRDAKAPADHGNAFAMTFESALILLAGRRRVEVNIATTFKVVKQHCAIECKRQFVGIEHMKQNQFVSGRSESSEMPFQFIDRREQIRDQDDETPFAHEFGDALQWLIQIG
jgi:hypothetical protein